MADPLIDAVEDYVVRACLPLAQRMVELERQQQGLVLQKGDPGEPGARGADGIDGKDADADDLLVRFAHAVERKFLSGHDAT